MDNTGLTEDTELREVAKVTVAVPLRIFEQADLGVLLRTAAIGRNHELQLGCYLIVYGAGEEIAQLKEFGVFHNYHVESNDSDAFGSEVEYCFVCEAKDSVIPNIDATKYPVRLYIGRRSGPEHVYTFLKYLCRTGKIGDGVNEVCRLFLREFA